MKCISKQIQSLLVLAALLNTPALFAAEAHTLKANPKMAKLNLSLAETQASSSSSNVMQIQNNGISSRKGLGFIAGLEYAQKNAVDQNGTRSSETNLVLVPSYTINSNFALNAKGVITKQNSGPKDTTYSNTTIALAISGLQLSENFRTIHSVAGIIPTSQDNQKVDRLLGGVAIKNGFAFDYGKLNFKYSLTLSQNVHEFNMNAVGEPNIQYRIGHTLTFALFVTDHFYVTAEGILREGRTYGGFSRQAFGVDADLNYDVLKNLSINLGTSNEGSAFKSNGVDSNISAYNDNTSVVRAGVSYVY